MSTRVELQPDFKTLSAERTLSVCALSAGASETASSTAVNRIENLSSRHKIVVTLTAIPSTTAAATAKTSACQTGSPTVTH
jgi:hypothetical protein